MEITLRVNYWLIRKILEQNNRTYLIVAIPIMRFFITLKPKPLRVDSILLPSLPHYVLYWKLILHNIYRITVSNLFWTIMKLILCQVITIAISNFTSNNNSMIITNDHPQIVTWVRYQIFLLCLEIFWGLAFNHSQNVLLATITSSYYLTLRSK